MLYDKDIREPLFDFLEETYGKIRIIEEKTMGRSRAELDRAEQHRKYISKAITDGIKASTKKSGRKEGSMDKLTDELIKDINLYLSDRHITQTELMKKYNISRNTLKKYIAYTEKRNRAQMR